MLAARTPTAASPAAGTSLQVGDRLAYAVTVELQQHHVSSGATSQDKNSETAAQGAETFSVYAIGSDGTAYANAVVSFAGSDNGRPIEFQKTTAAKVLADGQLRMKDRVGAGVSDAIGFANATSREIAQHALSLGSVWTTVQQSPYARLTVSRRVSARTSFQGLTAYEVQTTGSGVIEKTTDGKPASGTIAVSATSYYDAQHRLLIGEALKTLTVIRNLGDTLAHDTYSETTNVVLSSWTHVSSATPQGAAPLEPSSATTLPPAADAPTPAAYAPTPYPTVTPRLDS
jgi:hypothetical protein